MSAIFIDCTDDMIGPYHQIRQDHDPAVEINMSPGQPGNVAQLVEGYSAAIVDHTYFNAELLAGCPSLRHIVFLGTGAASFIDLEAAGQHGIQVHTIKGYGDTTVAEHTLALVLSAAREVARMDREVRAGLWRQIEGVQLLGKTLGIIGMGGIGKELARLGQGIGMRVMAWNRSKLAAPAAPMHALDEVLARADVLCLCLALNESTRGFLDAAKLRRTKKGVIFINTARADIVDNGALVALLHEGHIRHAALDVFSREPPDPADPILSAPNTTLTAHAGFMTPEASMTMLRRALDLVKQHDR